MKSTSTRPKRVLAFDPGYERLGFAVLERDGAKEKLVSSGCIRTDGKLPFHDRLFILGEECTALIKKFEPDAMALEEIFFQKNEKTAIKIAEVRGMLSFIAMQNSLTLHQFTPLEVKVAVTGYGRSDKVAVTVMVSRILLLPAGKKRLDDEMDAIAIGITCLAVS